MRPRGLRMHKGLWLALLECLHLGSFKPFSLRVFVCEQIFLVCLNLCKPQFFLLSNSWPTNSCGFSQRVSITRWQHKHGKYKLRILCNGRHWLSRYASIGREGGFSTFVWISFLSRPPPLLFLPRAEFVSLTDRGNFSVQHSSFRSPKAAVGFPHLSRKKVKALFCYQCCICALQFPWNLRKMFLASEVCVSRWRLYIYIFKWYIYIYVVFGEVVTGDSALVNRSVTHVAGFFGEVFSARWFWCVWK